jgi:signal transduction histidine kinase
MLLFIRPLLRCLVLLSLLIGASLPAWAGAHDHISQRAYWADTTAQATFAQAEQQDFAVYDGVLGKGYTNSALWVRLQITPPQNATPDDKLVLRIRPIYLDQITLHDPLDTSGRVRVAGDQTDYNDEEYKSLTHTFVIPAGTEPRFIWLRLKTTSTAFMHVEAIAMADIQADEHRLLFLYNLALALIVVFTVVTLINWFNYQEFLYAAFIVRNVVYFFYTAAFFGFHRYLLGDWMSGHALDLSYSWFVVFATGFSIWFEILFVSEYAPPRWARAIFWALKLWSLLTMALLALGFTHTALHLNMTLNGVVVVAMLVMSSIFIDDKETLQKANPNLLKKKYVVSYYLIVASLLLFSILPYMGRLAGNEFSANGLVYYALISGFNMTLLMQLRAHQRRKSNLRTEQELALSEQQIAFEKIRREEQSQMLTMLMHELKNPLAVIDLAQHASEDPKAKDYVTRNVAIIRNVLDQCLNTDRLSDGKISIDKSPIDLVELIDDVIEPHHPHPFQLSFPPNTQPLHAFHTDYQCVRTVLTNLIDNALRYGDPSQAIGIAVAPERNAAGTEGIAITVANLPGIASWPDPDKVFQKYYRSIGAKTISGTGLGLFLVRSLCTLMGGNCTYAPDDTHVKFKVWLPI